MNDSPKLVTSVDEARELIADMSRFPAGVNAEVITALSNPSPRYHRSGGFARFCVMAAIREKYRGEAFERR